ncbi:MAG: DUF4298 domain-containing protein [Erysipelotrichaceae bacterium]|nr:DUF4298 domain-containing protein [Erysipelotrichaceae bacterium]
MNEQIVRITEYERMMDEAYRLMKAERLNARDEFHLRQLISSLKEYYESSLWKQDYEDDENGLLPRDLKRGVLSEDGLFDLLDDYRQYLHDRSAEYEFLSEFDEDHFTLHDCRVTSISYEDKCLTFEMPQGIYHDEYGKCWPNTGRAAVQWIITGEDEACLQVFVRESGKTIRYEYDLEDMMEKINSGVWELELGYRYRGLGALIYMGYIWLKEESRHYEVQLMIASRENEILMWNKPDGKQ